MHTDSVRTEDPPGQAGLVPPGMTRLRQWRADGIDLELWTYRDTGFVLANPSGSFEVAGRVDLCGDRMTIVWQGTITAQSQPWLNAQRARAARAYFGGPDE